jgi:ribosomal protein S27AE
MINLINFFTNKEKVVNKKFFDCPLCGVKYFSLHKNSLICTNCKTNYSTFILKTFQVKYENKIK